MKRLEPIVFVREIATASEPSAVMRLLGDPATWASWQPEILHVEGPSPMQPGDEARGRARMLGFEVHGRSTALDVGTRHFEEDAVVGIHMQIRYDVMGEPGNTRVRHTLRLEPSHGIAGRLLTWLLRRRLARMQREALENLAASAERASP